MFKKIRNYFSKEARQARLRYREAQRQERELESIRLHVEEHETGSLTGLRPCDLYYEHAERLKTHQEIQRQNAVCLVELEAMCRGDGT